jgi:tetratricopeptide (TPR) repeat protein
LLTARLLLITLAAAALSACASVQRAREAPRQPVEQAAELTNVPFFPQTIHECGPAALATTLAASGIPVTPDDLVPKVYIPGRRGSLQTELIAAARTYERLPYVLDHSLEAIAREVRAGRPVLVLQNLGLRWLPRWHYAVVVGVTENRVILRSGRKQRLQSRMRTFQRTWSYADEWAVVFLKPGEMPIEPNVDRWVAANAALEATGQQSAARLNYEAASHVWPDHSLVWLGLGNTRYRAGDRAAAEAAFKRAVDLDAGNAAALNNLAQTLAERGCREQARVYVQRARSVAPPELRHAVEATENEIATASEGAARDSVACSRSY